MNPNASTKICWIVQGTESYGLAQAILTLTQAVRDQGVGVRLIAMAHGELAERADAAGLRVDVLGVGRAPVMGGSLRNRLASINVSRRHAQRSVDRALPLFADETIDVVHCTSPALVGVTGRLAARLGARGVWEIPNVLGDGARLRLGTVYFQALVKQYRMIVLANSAYTARSFGTWPARARVFHLGADAQRFDPHRPTDVTRASLNIPEDAAVLTIAARIDELKGQAPFFEALLRLGPGAADVHLLLLGGPTDGPVADRLRALSSSADAGHRLHFAGSVDQPERYYAVTDIAVNAYVKAEAFGLSVVEAMLMARPVLAHAAGGPGETVLDGETGWLTTDPTIDGWTRVLQRVLNDRERWPDMGRRARGHALAHFTAARQAQRYFALLREHGVEVPAAGDGT